MEKGLHFCRPFNTCQARLRGCRKKAFEENPLLPGGQSLLASESPIEVGVSDPTRPDFPEYGYRFFQTLLSIQTPQGSARNYIIHQIID